MVVGVACGTNTMDLLPLGVGGGTSSGAVGTGGGGGSELMTTGGNAAGGGTGGTSAGTGGDAASGSSGAPSAGGGATSGDGGCGGVGCGGDAGGQGGDSGECTDRFCPCGPQGQCSMPWRCNERLGLCLPECDGPWECPEGFLCEESTCAACTEDTQCERYGPFLRTVCVNGRCEECAAPSDCPLDSPICFGRRCVECVTNDDCVGGLCNKWGRCEN
jgi:hypothetical protein